MPFFLVGVWIGASALPKYLWYILLVVAIGWLSVRIFHVNGWLSYPQRWRVGLVLFISLFIAGCLIGSLQDERISTHHFSWFRISSFTGEVEQEPVRKGSALRSVLSVDAVLEDGKWRPAVGKVLVYFPQPANSAVPRAGHRVFISVPMRPAQPPEYPGQFDFSQWLSVKQVYHLVRLKDGQWTTVPGRQIRSISGMIRQLQQRLISCYRDAGLSGNELGVVSALVLGEDAEVESDLMRAFSVSGTLHILSVSGMHVALVYAALDRILSLVFRRKRDQRVRILLSLVAIWCYALLTGFSPAVRRAAAMLSLVLLGKAVNRQVDTWNLLSGSVLILVLFQPSLLRESGFQLSYAAVAGIVGFYPWLNERMGELNRAGELIAKSVAVALAAQWFTFPLGLYYFHQFPNYFLPANLVIIPWSTAVLFGGIILLLLHPFPMLFHPAAMLLQWMTQWLNRTVHFFERLPDAQTSGVWITGVECIFLLAAVIATTYFLVSRRNHYVFLSLLLLLSFFGSRIYHASAVSHRLETVRWKLNDLPLSVIFGNRSLLIIRGSDELRNERLMDRIRTGMDALGVPPEHRYVTTCSAPDAGMKLGFPVVLLSDRFVLPDTVVRYRKGSSSVFFNSRSAR